MPELVARHGVRFQLSPAGGLVGRHDDDGASADPDLDLGGIEGGRTVSRRHVEIYPSGQDWRLKVLARARNATLVAGQLMLPGQETVLHDGDEIQLGRVSLVFHADRDPNATLLRSGPAAAELRTDNLRVALSVPDGRRLSLGRHSDDRTYRPDVDLGDAADGKTISRRHGLLFQRGHTWYLRVEAETTNSTYLNGRPLQKGEETALADGDQLRMGNAVATFHQDKPFRYVDSDQLELVLGPPTDVTLEAGGQQAVPLRLVNFTRRVDWFILDVTGTPAEWRQIAVPGERIDADQRPQVRLDTAAPPLPTATATANMSLILKPPRAADARAGAYPLLITATSQDNRRLRRTATGQLVVLPFFSLRMKVDRPRASGVRGRFCIGVFNDGNAPTTVALGVETDAKVEARLQHTELSLPNGGDAQLELNLRVKRRPWFGPEVVHTASITGAGDQQLAAQQVSLSCPPRIPIWLQKLFGRLQKELKPIVVAVALVAALLVAGYYWLFPPDVKLVPETALVASGASTQLSWSVARGRGEAVLEGPSGSQQVQLPRGQLGVNPDQTVEYKLTARNLIGLTTTTTARVQVLRVASFTASSDTLKQPGDPVTLQWTTENATAVSIDPADEITSPPVSGKVVVHPRASTTYHLVATNDQFKARVTAEARASFGAPRIAQFQQDHQQVNPGDAVLLTWVADGITKLTLKSPPDDLELKGTDQDVTRRTSIQVRPIRGSQYTLVAANSDGTTADAQVTIGVIPIKPPRFQTPVKPVPAGDTATLTWQLEGANDRTTVILQPDGIDVSGRSSVDVRPGHTTQYTLTVQSADGQTVASEPVSVPVLPAVQEFRVVPAAITEGDPVVLSWNVLDADSVTVTRDDGVRVALGGAADEARDHPPATVTSYLLKARNATGESADSPASVVKIKVQPPPTPTPVQQVPQLPGV